MKRIRRRHGDVVRIDLGSGTCVFARVLIEPLFEFFDRSVLEDEEVNPSDIVADCDVLFRLDVMNYAVSKGVWPVVGHVPLSEEEKNHREVFAKKDAISGRLFLYSEDRHTGAVRQEPATFSEVAGLERAAVWDPEHVEERLRDHLAGRPNKSVESLRITDDS